MRGGWDNNWPRLRNDSQILTYHVRDFLSWSNPTRPTFALIFDNFLLGLHFTIFMMKYLFSDHKRLRIKGLEFVECERTEQCRYTNLP